MVLSVLCRSAFVFVAVVGIAVIDDFLTELICGRVAAVARIAVNLLLSESIRGPFDEVNFCKSLRLKLGMFSFLFLFGCCSKGCCVHFRVGGGLCLHVNFNCGLGWRCFVCLVQR